MDMWEEKLHLFSLFVKIFITVVVIKKCGFESAEITGAKKLILLRFYSVNKKRWCSVKRLNLSFEHHQNIVLENKNYLNEGGFIFLIIYFYHNMISIISKQWYY